MSILFTQGWNIIHGKEEQYADFIADEYIPQCNKIGLRSVGGFYVVVGTGPRIISVKSTETLEELSVILSEKIFKNITLDLKEFIVNYESKILTPTGRVKHEKYEIQKGVWKFNQYYDLIPGMKDEYADFIINEYIPTIEKLDFVYITGGWNVIIGGISEIIAEFTFKNPVDIGRLLDHDDYRNLTNILCNEYVSNYTSRIMRTTERYERAR
ncbi:MAG: hypothetical protein JXA35_10895 [Deltaproteobacteria bacterium]|nr:hypothetical protein [Deltaproteobacteria bacterium]